MHSYRVLVVDDESAQRHMFGRLFGGKGWQTFLAESGDDALKHVRDLRPDLVLADVSMPGMDGTELFRTLRAVPETADIPVLLMTGLSLPEGLLQAASAGLGAVPICLKGDLPSLVARAGALVVARGRSRAVDDGHVLRRGSVALDLIHREVSVAGHKIPHLAAKRFELFLALFRRDGPITQEELLTEVWGGTGDSKTVQVTVARLREDLKDFPALLIRTDAHTYQLLIAPTSKS